MPRTILSVAFPFAPVGPGAVGGSEQVLSAVDSALVRRGDRSVVVACQGSEAAGQLYEVPLPQSETFSDFDRIWVRKRVQAAIDRAIGAHSIDAIHMHGFDFAEYVLPRNIPVVATLHLPITWYGESLFNKNAQRAWLCCVSETQRKSCPPALGSVSVVENGVDLPDLPLCSDRGDYALVLGRICPEKNAHEALEAGTLARTPVYVAGQVFPYPEHQQYFAEKLEPLFSQSGAPVQHRLLGPVGPSERSRLLAKPGAFCTPPWHPRRVPLSQWRH